MGRCALADPVFADGRADAHQHLFVLAGFANVQRLGNAHGHGQCGLALDDQIGEHVLHQRLLGQAFAKR